MDEQTFIFCPRCGARFSEKTPRLLNCGDCGLNFFINPRPCNAVIIENVQGKIMLVKRKADPHKGMWDLPGGFMDIKETAQQSLTRELREELHVDLSHFRYLSSYADRYLYKEVNYHTLCFVYAAKIQNIPIRPGDDISSYAFFSKKSLPYDEIAFGGLKSALKEYIRKSPTL